MGLRRRAKEALAGCAPKQDVGHRFPHRADPERHGDILGRGFGLYGCHEAGGPIRHHGPPALSACQRHRPVRTRCAARRGAGQLWKGTDPLPGLHRRGGYPDHHPGDVRGRGDAGTPSWAGGAHGPAGGRLQQDGVRRRLLPLAFHRGGDERDAADIPGLPGTVPGALPRQTGPPDFAVTQQSGGGVVDAAQPVRGTEMGEPEDWGSDGPDPEPVRLFVHLPGGVRNRSRNGHCPYTLDWRASEIRNLF